MGSEYDRKFEEMKKYIPFLESMIRKLENTSSASSNPRQAQLDKIKSLRDLLLDKKKRMKMENLLKCEQVLVNLYAKVEQKDTLPGIAKQVPAAPTPDKSKTDLDAVRNKLKTVTMKDSAADTLPEIARASESEVICTPGSKEPALFQRRPNKNSVSPTRRSSEKSPRPSSKSPSKSKRNYTRVLVSPETSSRRWTSSEDITEEKPLFMRRSPRRSPRRHSPFYHKKERKKSKEKENRKQKDLNITLKVPEDSLESLNTKDILSRIINCSDNDVDIDTLRELRSQIIGELKDTGAQDDISDLILKSYKHKKKSKKKQQGEIEDGELSDSESETIGNIYGNLKIFEKDPASSSSQSLSNESDTTQRKIQICLVINSENETCELKSNIKDEQELIMLSDHDVNKELESDIAKTGQENALKPEQFKEQTETKPLGDKETSSSTTEENNLIKEEVVENSEQTSKTCDKVPEDRALDIHANVSSGFRANFYKPQLSDNDELKNKIETVPNSPKVIVEVQKQHTTEPQSEAVHKKITEEKGQANKNTVSEIDILQALKNDILSETLSIPGSEATTPALHQPKVTKVASTQEIAKKRISIEKYKAKSVNKTNSLFVKEPNRDNKKSSLKLTEKEFERFKLNKLAFGDSSDDDAGPASPLQDIYEDLVPRSPDSKDKTASDDAPPVIIPENPLKATSPNIKSDIDMRKPLLPLPVSVTNDATQIKPKIDEIVNKPLLFDPRVRRDLNRSVSKDSPNPHLNPDRTPRSSLPAPSFPNMTPSRTPNSLSFEMTPSHSFYEEQPSRKHVYAPLFTNDTAQEEHQKSGQFSPLDCPPTSAQSFLRQDGPMTPSHPFGRGGDMTPNHSFGRGEAPMTPSHPFGRSEAPMTSNHSFGRSEAPMTPNHTFGRSDAPLTPSHPFGRSDVPTTPNHPFGRSDAPTTPKHPFGRNDAPIAPSHSFGRNEMPLTPSHHALARTESGPSHGFGRIDPRLYRNSEYEKRLNDTGHYQIDRNQGQAREYSRFNQDRSIGRNERDVYDRRSRPYHRDGMTSHRQSRRDYESEYLYSRDRSEDERFHGDNHFDYERRRYSDFRSQRERSVGRPIQGDCQPRMEKALSIGRRTSRAPSLSQANTDTVSVKPQSDHSFNINTSVSSTFQNDLDTKTFRFDERKRRAASVGRSLEKGPGIGRSSDFNSRRQRASSVGRSLKQNPLYCEENFEQPMYKKNYFHRSSSMGRELNVPIKEKTWVEIKAEFANYKLKEMKIRQEPLKKKTEQKEEYKTQKNYSRDPRGKNETKKSSTYSPRKNFRDPRMRKDDERDKKYDRHGNPKEGKSHGIVYSSDNIAQGKILGPGYGVKNYKIPKIKRPVEEIKEKEKETLIPVQPTLNDKIESKLKVSEKSKDSPKRKIIKKQDSKEEDKNDKLDSNVVSKKSETRNKQDETLSDIFSSSDNDTGSDRVTRSRKIKSLESKPLEIASPSKTRRAKKAIIDSDSDTDQKEDILTSIQNIDPKPVVQTNSKLSPKKSPKKNPLLLVKDPLVLNQDESIDTNFGIDDLEIFPENMVSDPVLTNIDALIADLDNDITTTKRNSPNNEADAHSLFHNICSPDNFENQSQVDENSELSFKYVEELLKKNEESSTEKSVENSESILLHSAEHKEPVTTSEADTNKNISEQDQNRKIVPSGNTADESSVNDKKDQIEPLSATIDRTVSTSQKSEENNIKDNNSTPDSTINVNQSLDISQNEDGLPDSTNEISNDNTDIDVQSSANKNEEKQKPSNSTDIDSIENLLTILQDKDKIKKLLNMLGNEDQNEKIKKKLAKLSEIVESDDEDSKEDFASKNNEKDRKLDDSNNFEKDKELVITSGITVESKKDINPKEDEIEETNSCSGTTEDLRNKEINSSGDVTLKPQEINQSSDDAKIFENQATLNEDKSKKKITVKKGKAKSVIKKPLKRTRVTRANTKKTELQKLQEDIKDMFLKTDVLNTSGIRMCRLAKMVDDKNTDEREEIPVKENAPVVALKKIKDQEISEIKTNVGTEKPLRKKPGPKPKAKVSSAENKVKANEKSKPALPCKPGPKSKTKRLLENSDPYLFETDSINDTSVATTECKSDSNSESENESNASSSIGSMDPIVELKKKSKRRRRAWQSGIIKPKNRKNKSNVKLHTVELDKSDSDNLNIDQQWTDISIPDLDCFTDKKYCFLKDITKYPCRLCHYIGNDIVSHYKTDHPHSEVPLSRMHPDVAQEAIDQCEIVNFQAISKMPTEKYICRFCFKEFRGSKNILERFFWHIVSTHTGEYRQVCSECVNMTTCPMNLDIIPPPKDTKGQLIGYICQKCNYTQISLENLKHHVISRHDDEQTEVYTINLAVMTNEMIESLIKKCNETVKIEESSRQIRSSRSNVSLTEASDNRSDDNSDQEAEETPLLQRKKVRKSIQSKISFENDDNSIISTLSSKVKVEPSDKELQEGTLPAAPEKVPTSETIDEPSLEVPESSSNDVVDYPHFKIHFNETGNKEYVCCINGTDNHYKTTLLISMKKHVQTKHSEIWDGYCFICRAIVTPQGKYLFKNCFQHCLERHIDSFPILEKPVEETPITETPASEPQSDDPPLASDTLSEASSTPTRHYINVRPLAELLSNDVQTPEIDTLPKIESVVSLGSPVVPPIIEPPQISPNYQYKNPVQETQFVPTKYEEAQAEIMSQKHRVVLEPMMAPEKLARIYKCAGRFCSFTTDSADEALLHASTHQRIGGENSLKCAYCDFDPSGNAIDLVMHIFKIHALCQYLCGQCFYRAGSSQLVGAHIERFHKEAITAGSVLKTKLLAPSVTNDSSGLLPREVAVPFYICVNGDPSCNFKTYTPGKFCDHMVKKHDNDTSFSCCMCEIKVATPVDLVNHLKNHGLKRYQCTWCVYGADNESELLAHASEKHPAKQPQAYLRIITNKEGTKDYRVLPLAYLNKSKVNFQEVTPSNIAENAVKEAERSIELEALIGSLISDSMFAAADVGGPGSEASNSAVVSAARRTDDDVTLTPVPPGPPGSPTRLHVPSPPPAAADLDDVVTKTENADPPPPHPPPERTSSEVVICLDSDDESAPATPQKKSPKEKPQESKKIEVPMVRLFTCPKCKRHCRNSTGFSRHVVACCDNLDATGLACPHCTTFRSLGVKGLVAHLLARHGMQDEHLCSLCGLNQHTAAGAKKHLRLQHNVDQVRVSRSTRDERAVFVHAPAQPPAPPPAETYRPEDAPLLPITPIFESEVRCAECGFGTKVRLNMVRHLQAHAQQQPAASTAPVNPVPAGGERYFDKMLNLAASSIGSQRGPGAGVGPAGRWYPAFVEERTRRACGAPGCAYISVDDGMLRRHWDTLHAGAATYRCVHCPATQQQDTSQPLTAARILAHLRMHDAALYACALCPYYHFRRRVVDKHALEAHGAARSVVVREEPPAAALSAAPASAPPPAPTMDLKPWQCGLCAVRSMLRQQVAEHAAAAHGTRMQFRCGSCPFRASTLDNVTRHQAHAHVAAGPLDVIHYYYREGSLPDDADPPRWLRQRRRLGLPDVDVKTEPAAPAAAPPAPAAAPVPPVDLNLVKSEPAEATDLCAKYGQYCDPNGLKYKCPLCKVVTEEAREAMQSHLFEELQYRRWSCSVCSYKAFHHAGLAEHAAAEHAREPAPLEPLPADAGVEAWVRGLLQHQAAVIDRNRGKLQEQRILTPPVTTANVNTETPAPAPVADEWGPQRLQQTFGPLGASVDGRFACPKCEFTTADEALMHNHLESELNKIRWSCSSCSEKFVSYHEAQFHCKLHGGAARPRDVTREPAARAAWAAAVLRAQRPAAAPVRDVSEPDGDSLLAVRFVESVPTPEEVSLAARKRAAEADSDDDRLLIDEASPPTKTNKSLLQSCPHCDFKSMNAQSFRRHVRRHNAEPRPGTPQKRTDLKTYRRPTPAEKSAATVETALAQSSSSQPAPAENALQRPPGVPKEFLSCSYCSAVFNSLKDMLGHHHMKHPLLTINYVSHSTVSSPRDEAGSKRKAEDVTILPTAKKTARKSTTKLPNSKVARKSTTKLPHYVYEDSDNEVEYSFYGTEPTPLSEYENVTTMMPFCNTMMPFKMKQLREIIKIEPVVFVTDYLKMKR